MKSLRKAHYPYSGKRSIEKREEVMTNIDYEICKTQQQIYEYMASEHYDMEVFSNAYLSSVFCKRSMDTEYSRFQVADALECADFYMPEIESQLVKFSDNRTFDIAIAGWIGFTYRQLYIETGVYSAELIKIVPFEIMCQSYYGLHTIDEENAVDIIIDNHKDVLKRINE